MGKEREPKPLGGDNLIMFINSDLIKLHERGTPEFQKQFQEEVMQVASGIVIRENPKLVGKDVDVTVVGADLGEDPLYYEWVDDETLKEFLENPLNYIKEVENSKNGPKN